VTTTDHPSTTERRQTSENRLPAPAAARTAADSGAPPPRKTSKATAHTSAKAQK